MNKSATGLSPYSLLRKEKTFKLFRNPQHITGCSTYQATRKDTNIKNLFHNETFLLHFFCKVILAVDRSIRNRNHLFVNGHNTEIYTKLIWNSNRLGQLPEALKTKFPSEKHSNYFHFWSSYHVFSIHNMANLFPQCTLNEIIKATALF